MKRETKRSCVLETVFYCLQASGTACLIPVKILPAYGSVCSAERKSTNENTRGRGCLSGEKNHRPGGKKEGQMCIRDSGMAHLNLAYL